jgi:hypothetical protein
LGRVGCLADVYRHTATPDAQTQWRGAPQGRRGRANRCTTNCRKRTASPAYCVIPFLLPPPKNPCSTRAKKASQAGRRRFDPGRPLSRKRRLLAAFRSAAGQAPSESQPPGWNSDGQARVMLGRRWISPARHREKLLRNCYRSWPSFRSRVNRQTDEEAAAPPFRRRPTCRARAAPRANH